MTPLKQQLLDAIATAPDSLIAQLLTYLQTLIQPSPSPTLRLSTRIIPPRNPHNYPNETAFRAFVQTLPRPSTPTSQQIIEDRGPW